MLFIGLLLQKILQKYSQICLYCYVQGCERCLEWTDSMHMCLVSNYWTYHPNLFHLFYKLLPDWPLWLANNAWSVNNMHVCKPVQIEQTQSSNLWIMWNIHWHMIFFPLSFIHKHALRGQRLSEFKYCNIVRKVFCFLVFTLCLKQRYMINQPATNTLHLLLTEDISSNYKRSIIPSASHSLFTTSTSHAQSSLAQHMKEAGGSSCYHDLFKLVWNTGMCRGKMLWR